MFIFKYILFLYYYYIVQKFIQYASKYECDLYFNKKGHNFLTNTNIRYSICIRKQEIKKTYILESNISKQLILKLNSKFWLVFYTLQYKTKSKYNLKIFYFKNFPALKYHFILNETDFKLVTDEFFGKNIIFNNSIIYLNKDENSY